jgi:RNA methyltransferase, TrmH family
MKIITSLSHDLVKHAVRLKKDRSYRLSTNTVLVEGKNLLLDLMKRHTPKNLFLTEDRVSDFPLFPQITIITKSIAEKISSVESPEGCFAEFILPKQKANNLLRGLILDRLQDPGNVGTLLRTALAFDINTIFLIEPCCDPWNPKAIRAAKAAQFDLTIVPCQWRQIPPMPLYVADVQGEDIATVTPPSSWLLTVSNEACGQNTPEFLRPIFVKIPMLGPVESLNVAQAGAILLYHFQKGRLTQGTGRK